MGVSGDTKYNNRLLGLFPAVGDAPKGAAIDVLLTMEQTETLKANTDQPLAPDSDYSGLRVAPPAMLWLATAVEAAINALLWLADVFV